MFYKNTQLHLKDIKKYFKQFNDVVFNKKLSAFGDVKIKDLSREKCQVKLSQWSGQEKELDTIL